MLSCVRSASTAEAISGYCSLAAIGSPSSVTARCTCPARRRRRASGRTRRSARASRGLARPACAASRRQRPSARPGLQLHQLFGIVCGQGVRDGREQLRDLHHRALHRAQGRGEGARVVVAARPGQPACATRAAKAPTPGQTGHSGSRGRKGDSLPSSRSMSLLKACGPGLDRAAGARRLAWRRPARLASAAEKRKNTFYVRRRGDPAWIVHAGRADSPGSGPGG